MSKLKKFTAAIGITAVFMTAGISTSSASIGYIPPPIPKPSPASTVNGGFTSPVVQKIVQTTVNLAVNIVTNKGTNPTPNLPSVAKAALNVVQNNGGAINTVVNVVKYVAIGGVAVVASFQCAVFGDC